MKAPVVKSNDPNELNLVIKQLVREINALSDRILLLEKRGTNGG